MRRLIALGVVAAGLAFAAQPVAAADRDCSDFATHRQAQKFFKRHGGPARDPHRLDADHDGIACESLPRPQFAAVSSIGLTRREAMRDAELVVRQYWPTVWRHHARTLHCLGHGHDIPCPPVTFYKRISPEEVELLYGLIRSSHPYTEMGGNVYIHSDPASARGFYYKVNRCRYTPPFGCWEVGSGASLLGAA